MEQLTPSEASYNDQARATGIPSSGATDARRSKWIRYLIVVVVAVLTYNLIFFNRYLPITEGWFSVYAEQINGGKVPYRDFYLFLPPAYPMLLSAFAALFGYGFLGLRIAGILLMCTFATVLFAILRKCFAEWIAAAVAISVTIYYQSGVAHIAYDFVQVMSTCVLLSTYCLMLFSAEPTPEAKHSIWSLRWAIVAGALCGIATMTKQSNGSIVTVFCGIAAFVAGARQTWFRGLLGFAGYLFGFTIVLLSVVVWLVSVGAWHEFVDQVIFDAISAKGSLSVIIFAFLGNFFGATLIGQISNVAPYLSVTLLWALLLCRYFRKLWAVDTENSDRWLPLTVLGGALLAILLPRWLATFAPTLHPAGWDQIENLIIPCGVIGALTVGMVLLVFPLVTRQRPSILLVPVLASLGLIWGNGTSAGLSETGVFLGLALFLCVLLSHANWFTPVALVLAAVIWLQTVFWVEYKYSHPYAWWGIKECDIRESLVAAPDPLQHGILVGPETARVYREVIAMISHETRPGDRVLIFPHTPVFYLLCDRALMGRAVVEWFDFLPDALALREADILRHNPPNLIVWLEIPETVWLAHERLFRGGLKCGQREIKKAYEQLLIDGRVREVGIVRVSEGFVFHFGRLQSLSGAHTSQP